MNALETVQLTKRYDDGLLALDAVDLAVPDGEFFGLLGPNGAGKTTLISAVCNLIRVTSGEVHIFGRPSGEARRVYVLGTRVFDVQVALRLDAHAESRERFSVKLSKGARGKTFVEARRALEEERVRVVGRETRVRGQLTRGPLREARHVRRLSAAKERVCCRGQRFERHTREALVERGASLEAVTARGARLRAHQPLHERGVHAQDQPPLFLSTAGVV